MASKLKAVLSEDLDERAKDIPGPTVFHIHNVVLFDCLIMLNSLPALENSSREAVREYLQYAETIRPKFMDIMESLKDFQPTVENSKDDVSGE